MEMSFYEGRKRNNLFGVDDAAIAGISALSQTPVGKQVSDAIGDILHGKPEDRSTDVFNSVAQKLPQVLPYFPSREDMAKASQGWEGHIKNSVSQFYNPSTGTWDNPNDDWKGAVVALNPIQAYVFKGHGEKASLNSAVNATAPIITKVTGTQNQSNSVLSGSASLGGIQIDNTYLVIIAFTVIIVTALLIYNANK